MSFDAVARTRAYHAALNAYDAGAVKAFFAENASYVSPGVNGAIRGRDAIITAFSAYFAEYPDQQAVDDSIALAGPRRTVSVWRLRATARSTGQRCERCGLETLDFDQEGLIISVEIEDR